MPLDDNEETAELRQKHPELSEEALRRLAIVNRRIFGGCGDVNPSIANSTLQSRPNQANILLRQQGENNQ